MINKCWSHVILQGSPIFVTSCISGHYWMKLLYSRPTKQPPTFLKNTASSAHYDMANDIPSGHLLCCTSHSCDMLHLSCGHLLLLGHFIYIWDLPSAPTENLTAWNWWKELFCSTVKGNYRTLCGDPVDEFVELALLTWKQICNANLSLTLRGLFL